MLFIINYIQPVFRMHRGKEITSEVISITINNIKNKIYSKTGKNIKNLNKTEIICKIKTDSKYNNARKSAKKLRCTSF